MEEINVIPRHNIEDSTGLPLPHEDIDLFLREAFPVIVQSKDTKLEKYREVLIDTYREFPHICNVAFLKFQGDGDEHAFLLYGLEPITLHGNEYWLTFRSHILAQCSDHRNTRTKPDSYKRAMERGESSLKPRYEHSKTYYSTLETLGIDSLLNSFLFDIFDLTFYKNKEKTEESILEKYRSTLIPSNLITEVNEALTKMTSTQRTFFEQSISNFIEPNIRIRKLEERRLLNVLRTISYLNDNFGIEG